MSDEAVINYSSDILVKVRHNQEVSVTLSEQGPQGPQGEKGETGSITPELATARNEAVAAAANAKISETNSKNSETAAKTAQTNAAGSATAASTAKAGAETAKTAAETAAQAANSAKLSAVEAKDDAEAAQTVVTAAKDAAAISATNASASKDAAASSAATAAQAANDADLSAGNSAQSATDANDAKQSAQSSADAALTSKNAASAAEANALTYRNTASAHKTAAEEARTAAEQANTDAQNAKTATEAAQSAAETARNQAQTAKSSAETAKALAETARDAAQTARSGAEVAIVDAEAARDAAEGFADAAALSAAEAAKFDPSSYPMKVNNGSDFDDPAQVRINIGAAEALETVTEAEATSGTGSQERNWTAQRVRQAISAYAPAKAHLHAIADVNGLQAALDTLAPLSSPVFTGTPMAPTAEAKDNSARIATTEYVDGAISDLIGGAVPETLDTLKEIADKLTEEGDAVIALTQQVAGKSDVGHKHIMADITDLAEALGLLAPKVSPVFTGNPTATTQVATDNSTRLATTAHVKAAIAASGLSTEGHKHEIADVNGLQTALDSKSGVGHKHVAADITDLQALLDAKAPLASPALTGNPTAPTQAVGNSSTRIATTAFVANAVTNGVAGKADAGHTHVIEDTTGLQDILDAKAALASPTFSGTPKAPTPAAGTNTTQIATAAFVTAAVSKFGTDLAISGVSDLQNALDAKWSKADLPASELGQTLLNLADPAAGRVALDLRAGQMRQYILNDFGVYGSSGSTIDINDLVAGNFGLYATSLANTPTYTGVNFWWIETQRLYSNDGKRQVASSYYASGAGKPVVMVRVSGGDGVWGSWEQISTSNAPNFSGHVHTTGEFVSTATNAMRLANGGNAVILRKDGTHFYFLVADSADDDAMWNSARPFRFEIATGKVTMSHGLDVGGNIAATGNLSAYSDARLKTNIRTIEDALSKVSQMRGVSFTMNNTDGIGVVAQEIQKVIPEVVIEHDDENQTLSVAYGNIVAVLIEAVKELKFELDELKRAA